jgi:hypothetical protein
MPAAAMMPARRAAAMRSAVFMAWCAWYPHTLDATGDAARLRRSSVHTL